MEEVLGVRFTKTGKLHYFYKNNLELKVGDTVVASSERGLDLGRVVSITDNENVKLEEGDSIRKIERVATKEDVDKQRKLDVRAREVLDTCKKLAKRYNLEMKFIKASYTFDESKLTCYFVAEDRVDFRDLVKDLASHLKQRIELRQIGIRDQAKIIGAIGICGKECCCKEYLNDFDKVSIKMAKTQNLSLNPTKISGVCGRLMCCLSYENDFYSEIGKSMPKVNGLVSTPDGKGTVMYNNLLKQTVMVKIESDNDIKVVEHKLSDIKILVRDNNQNQPSKNDKANDKNNAKPNKK